MKYEEFLNKLMHYGGLEERDFVSALTEKRVMTTEMIVAITKFIDSVKTISVFITRNISATEIRMRFYDTVISYEFRNGEKIRNCTITVDLEISRIIVEFHRIDESYTIGNDLFDFEKEKTTDVSLFRMDVLNAMLTRYYTKLLYQIYLALMKERR